MRGGIRAVNILTAVFLVVNVFPIQAQDYETLLSNAENAYMENRYAQALEQYQAILAMHPADSVVESLALGYAGLCSEELGNPEDALGYYRKALLLQVPRLVIYDKMTSLAKAEDNDSMVEFAYLQKMAAFPDFEVPVMQSLAYHYYNTKQYKKLLGATRKLTGWYPDEPKFHYFEAIALQNTGDTQGAEAEFRKVLDLDPGNAGANMGLGMILYNHATELFTKAIKDYESIKNPDRVDYYNYNKNIEKPQAIYREALPYLLKAYENKSYSGLRGAIYNSYMRLEDMDNANKYKSD